MTDRHLLLFGHKYCHPFVVVVCVLAVCGATYSFSVRLIVSAVKLIKDEFVFLT